MKALILAAGRGRRLWPYTSERPKCLLPVGRQTILEHQLERLAAVGVSEVVVVAGFGFHAVRRQALQSAPPTLTARVIYNPFFAVADNLISLWAARAEMSDDFVLLNGDNVFHPQIPRLLFDDHPGPCTLLVHRKTCYDEDDMKVELAGDRLVRIGKDLCPGRVQAGSIGIMRFAGEAASLLRRVLEDAVLGEEALQNFYLDGVQRVADAGCPVLCRDVGDLPWMDVDTPDELLFVRDHCERFSVPRADRIRDRA